MLIENSTRARVSSRPVLEIYNRYRVVRASRASVCLVSRTVIGRRTRLRARVRTVRVHARHAAVGAPVRRPLQFRVRTLVHVRARFPIVVQLQPVRTHAERRAHRVYAPVRTPGRPVPALVHVVARVPVVGQPGARHAAARTPVTAPSVCARALARPVPVAQQALVHVCGSRTNTRVNVRLTLGRVGTTVLHITLHYAGTPIVCIVIAFPFV